MIGFVSPPTDGLTVADRPNPLKMDAGSGVVVDTADVVAGLGCAAGPKMLAGELFVFVDTVKLNVVDGDVIVAGAAVAGVVGAAAGA